MIKDGGSIKVERDANGAQKAYVDLRALALVAIRQDRDRLAFVQEASWTYADSDSEAHAEGIRLCQEKWPTSEGWEHHVPVRKVTLHLDLLEANKS